MATLSDVESFNLMFKMMWNALGPYEERYCVVMIMAMTLNFKSDIK